MQRRKLLTILVTPVLAMGMMLLSAGPATSAEEKAADAKGDMTAEAKAADEKGYMIVRPSDGQRTKDGSTFYPTGPISDDTLVVIAEPDGSLPNGLTETQLTQMAAQNDALGTGTSAPSAGDVTTMATWSYTATSGGWSQAWQGSSIIGWDSSATVYYTFGAQWGTSQRNVGQGLGYYRGYNGTTFGTWSAWYNLGSATAVKGGGASVPWGNVAAYAKFRGQCATTTWCSGYFTP